MSDCEKYFDLISAYIDGELSASEEDELKAHLASCKHCRVSVERSQEHQHCHARESDRCSCYVFEKLCPGTCLAVSARADQPVDRCCAFEQI
ncbi:MAG: zf-HC2 domain-containing protein [Oscillospiraceae bacterium]|nr:zf-HC2 domain-containing protein [Oscillospiraceae bacterium]